jgi:hypothetical protein
VISLKFATNQVNFDAPSSEPSEQKLALAWATVLFICGLALALFGVASSHRLFGLVLTASGVTIFFVYLHMRSRAAFLLSNPPQCRVCQVPMVLLDQRPERWYCRQDSQLYYGRERRWVELQHAEQIPAKLERRGVIGFLESIGLGIGYILIILVMILAALALIYWLRPTWMS